MVDGLWLLEPEPLLRNRQRWKYYLIQYWDTMPAAITIDWFQILNQRQKPLTKHVLRKAAAIDSLFQFFVIVMTVVIAVGFDIHFFIECRLKVDACLIGKT